MNRLLAVLFVALMLLVCGPRFATASSSSPPPQGEFYCGLEVRYMLPVFRSQVFTENQAPSRKAPTPFSEKGTEIAVGLGTDTGASVASGVLTLYAGNDRYDVPFRDLPVIGFSDHADEAAPLLIQLPAGVTPDAAYVSQINRPEPTVCPPGYIWRGSYKHYENTYGAPDAGGEAAAPEFHTSKLNGKIANHDPIVVSKPVVEPEPSCAVPDAPAKAISLASGNNPLPKSGAVDVIVLVKPNGSAGGVGIYRSSGDPTLDRVAEQFAYDSTFSPDRFRCRPAFGKFLFHVDFALH